MPSKSPVLYPNHARLLAALGQRLQDARLRRRHPATMVAGRADISRQTLGKVERGDPSVTMGTYVRVLVVLGLETDLAAVAGDDIVGRRLQDAELRTPRRVRKLKPEAPVVPDMSSTSGADGPSRDARRPNSSDAATPASRRRRPARP